ncbi:hypothetical protein [Stenotrophomonas sp. MMGLT7]|uniref:hypothetical protein n=1 Tax=Stenotrophomonas sp. MMGLT7 TaxID=2901227 RepID=UPI001E372BDD|nr:hypothetical protein [Stenotrophomonas sp. MMGLT7]MCD7099257.1 hypothetical protein [Stenotrophomonas sp. MMGLT7]
MHKTDRLMTQPHAAVVAHAVPSWHAEPPAAAPAPLQRPPLALALYRMRRRHIAAHAALLDVLIPDTLHA